MENAVEDEISQENNYSNQTDDKNVFYNNPINKSLVAIMNMLD